MRLIKPNTILYQDSETTIILLESSVHGNMECMLDTEDYPIIKNYHWHIIKQHNVYYAARGYYKDKKNHKGHSTIYMHREISNIDFGMVDHADTNGLNNKKLNFRFCTNSQNQANRPIDKRNKTGYKGVFPQKNGFSASIRINNKSHYLGSFGDDVSAARAYNAAAFEHFGEFARLNNV